MKRHENALKRDLHGQNQRKAFKLVQFSAQMAALFLPHVNPT
jgi:hypothetical protein